jgi:uridine kinase
MNEARQEPLAKRTKVVAEIQRLISRQEGPIVVALDGGSGAGKSTLASWIADCFDAALIPLDDFFAASIPDAQWDRFTVEQRLAHVFDWRRVRHEVIMPLCAGQPARWRSFDFASGLRPDGTYGMLNEVIERAPAEVIVIEGAYAAGPALADLVDLAILVDVAVEERHARLRAREDPGFLADWHQRWDAVERYYFTQVRPPSAFDLVVRLE